MPSNTAIDFGLSVHSIALNGLSESQTTLIFRDLLDTVTDLCFVVSSGQEHFTYLNKSVADALGYQLAEITSMSAKAIVSPSSLANVCDIIHRTSASQKDLSERVDCPPMYIELLKKDRSLVIGTMYCTLQLTHDNSIVAISGIVKLANAIKKVQTAGENGAASGLESASVRKSSSLPGKIIIMDDEGILVDIAVQMGRRLGLIVDAAKNGQEALSLYKKAVEEGAPHDAVLLDMTITGGMGGVEASKELHLIDPDVKTIVMSGYSDHEVMAKPFDFGFSGVISKPFRLNDFSRVLHSIIPEDKFRNGKG